MNEILTFFLGEVFSNTLLENSREDIYEILRLLEEKKANVELKITETFHDGKDIPALRYNITSQENENKKYIVDLANVDEIIKEYSEQEDINNVKSGFIHLLVSYILSNDTFYLKTDDITNREVLVNLIRKPLLPIEYNLTPKEDTNYKKIITTISNLKLKYIVVTLDENATFEDKSKFLDALLTTPHVFLPHQFLATIKYLLGMSLGFSPYPSGLNIVTENETLFDNEFYAQYLINEAKDLKTSKIFNLLRFFGSLPLITMSFLNVITRNLIPMIPNVEIIDDVNTSNTIPAYVGLLISDTTFTNALSSDINESKILEGKQYYYPSACEDYVYDKANLYTLLEKHGYLSPLRNHLPKIEITEEKKEDLNQIKHLTQST